MLHRQAPWRAFCSQAMPILPIFRIMNGRGGIQPGSHNAPVAPVEYTAVSLYAGAGGLDKGFSQARFKLLWAIESDVHAVETYRANAGDHVTHGELPDDLPPDDLSPDLVIGGPPCQGFSVIGRMDPDDPRSLHVHRFFDIVERLEPRAFCLENVKALATSDRWKPVREALLQRGRELEYRVELMVLNAADYGVPQARERMFLVGVRGGSPLCPVPTTKGVAPSVRDALEELPAFGEPGNATVTTAKVVPATKPVMRPTAYKGSLLFNGSGRPMQLGGPAKTLPASMGGNATPIIDQDELDNGSKPWVVGYHERLMRGEAPLKKAPSRLRRITVEEVAILQGFPSDWEWRGPRGAMYRQVGNAVPPILAESVGVSIRQALEAIDAQRGAPDKEAVASGAAGRSSSSHSPA